MSLALISASLALQAHGELPEARSYDNDEEKATIGVDAQQLSARSLFVVQTLPRARVATVVEPSGVK